MNREVLEGRPVAFRAMADGHQGEFVDITLRSYGRPPEACEPYPG